MRTGSLRPAPARFVLVWLAAVLVGAVVSCGSRTGLFGEGAGGSADRDAAVAFDAGTDVLPPVDVAPKPDVDRTGCPDAAQTYVYVVTESNELYSFYPPDLAFTFIGHLACPAPSGATPFSMAVDRRGVAYVLYDDGSLYRVSTATAACTATSFVPGQQSFVTFGMGFASDLGGPAERLYVSDNEYDGVLRGLGTIDTNTFGLSFIGPTSSAMRRSELTGTGDGRLFAYWPETTGPGAHLTELDKATGAILAQTDLPLGSRNEAFAFAFWGGDFWIFTGSNSVSDVNRFRPATGETTTPTTLSSLIVGAGVSTCAPQL